MRKIFIGLILLLVGAWLALWLGSAVMRRVLVSSSDRTWPIGLGPLMNVPARYPPLQMTSGAAQLIALSRPLGIDLAPRSRSEGMGGTGGPMSFVRSQLDSWVIAEVQRPSARIETMPSESGEYLAGHAGDLAAARTLLLSEEPIVWPQDVADPASPLPALLGHLQLGRVFIASALDRARVGDAGGWDDLRAAWKLSLILALRPDVGSNIAALANARRVNGAARKMPLPPPAWLAEVQAFDFRRAFLGAYQAGAWSIADRVAAETSVDGNEATRKVVDAVMAPYTRMSAVDMADAWREAAWEIARETKCDFDRAALEAEQQDDVAWWNFPAREISTPNLTGMWQNVFRFNAECEATVRALRLRAGQPAMAESTCADGRWVYAADGRSFAFSRNMPEPSVAGTAIPLRFALDARE
ncbi:MAG TPA: hypothetical protein VF057_05010 [Thermoanaerobaculia bacterium]